VLAVLATALLLAVVAAGGPAIAGTPPPSTAPSEGPSATTAPPVVTSPPASRGVKLGLVSQPAWIAADTSLPLGLEIEGAVDDGMTIDVVAYQDVDSRIGYDQALRGVDLPPVAGQVIRVPLPFLPPADTNGVRTLTLPLQTATDRDPNKLALRPTGAGVYPVEVSLADADGNQLATFITPVVVVAPQPNGATVVGEPLNVAWVWPLVTRPGLLPDGTPDPGVVAELGSGGRIGGEAVRLADHDVPVTLAPGPETLEAWRVLAAGDNPDVAATLDDLYDTLDHAQVLSGPYVPVDVPSLTAGGFADQVEPEYDRGFETLLNGLGVLVDESTAIVDPADERALSRLRDQGVTRVVVPDTALEPAADALTPAHPFLLESDSRDVTALAADSSLSRLLEGPDPAALRAQRFLGALALIALELPNERRGVVVLNDAESPPDLDVLDLALRGLATEHPLVDPVKVQALLNNTIEPAKDDDGQNIVRELAPITPVDPPVSRAQYDATAAALAGYRTLVPAPVPGSPAAALAATGDRALLTTLSSAWNDPEGRDRAQGELAAVTAGIQSFVGRIHVPVNPTITVTARTAEIPITFLNDTDQTVRVRVHLSSADLTFPDGPDRVIELPPRNTTVRFAVEARGSGTFPLSLRVTSPDGAVQLSQTEVQVRSTFVSNVGVFLTIGAVLFLAIWWGNDFRRRRRRRAAEAAPDPGAAATPPPAVAPGAPR
jgi:hypothetical protein